MSSSTLRIGIAGQRGAAFASALRAQPNTKIAALCNTDAATLNRQADELGVAHRFTSFVSMLEVVDAVIVSTPMQWHAAQSTVALNAGKHVLSEVTACMTLLECWQLRDAAVRAAQNGIVYAMAENYCYLRENVLIREMCRKGLFGEPYFGEGEYIHEVRNYHHNLDGTPTWRHFHQVGTPGVTYGTHSIGPLMQWFQAVRADERIESVVCMGSGVHTDMEHAHDDTSVLLCKLASGKLLRIRLDMMSNRPHLPAYYTLQGTRGVYEAARFGGDGKIWIGESRADENRAWRPLSEFSEHLPGEWRNPPPDALNAGHGGGDYYAARDFVRACLGEMSPATGIYDALEWTAAGLCSTISLQNGGVPIRLSNFRVARERPVVLDSPPVIVH